MGRRATGTVEALKGCIRLKFTFQGERRVETLDLKPTPANLKAAERRLGEIQDAIRFGTYRPERASGTKAETFREVADRWYETRTSAKSTLSCYRSSKEFWKANLPDRPVAHILASDIAKAVKAKVDAGATGKTVNNHLTVIRGIFKFASKDGLLTRNPAEGLEQHKHQAPLPDPFTADERDAILAHMTKAYPEPVLNYFEIMFHTGLRPSEAIALRWGDVDWNARSIRIQRASVLWEEKGTKTHSVRDVDLSRPAVAALKRQKVFTFMQGLDHRIFSNPVSGKPWADEQRQRRAYFQPTLRALGIRMRDTYNTRHTFATVALMSGSNPTYIAAQLGHTNAQMLFKRYARWVSGADKGAEKAKLDEILSRNCPRDADVV